MVHEVRFHGRGGQGAVMAAQILAVAAFHDGNEAHAFPFFGAERRGAPVLAFTRFGISPNPTRHPARFPIQLPTFFIKLMTKPGQLVFDPFAGTCTTALAAEMLERRWLVTELDEKFAVILPDRIKRGL